MRFSSLKCVEVGAGRSPDQGCDRQSVQPKPGALRIADLGYFSLKVPTAIDAALAFFLTRVPHHLTMVLDEGSANIVAWLTSQT